MAWLVLHLCLLSSAATCETQAIPVPAIQCAMKGQELAVDYMNEAGYPPDKWRLDRLTCQAKQPDRDA